MRSSRYIGIDEPVNLHIGGYANITVGELSAIYREWQALLRHAWKGAWKETQGSKYPTIHILAKSVTSEKSIDLEAVYAVHGAAMAANLVLGPLVDWPTRVKTAYSYIVAHWDRLERQQESVQRGDGDGGVEIETPRTRMRFPSHVLKDEEMTNRLERIHKRAIAGDLQIKVSLPKDQRNKEEGEDAGDEEINMEL